MPISFSEAIKKAREDLHTIIGLDIESTVSAEPSDTGWCVTLEALEKKAIPDSLDVLATYEAMLDHDGNIAEFRRIRLRKRSDTTEE
ncbi:MAG: gas vesicle protein [Desulfobacterales bacterium]|nr:gas vesicle protein [Desulfobacterales bacterium]